MGYYIFLGSSLRLKFKSTPPPGVSHTHTHTAVCLYIVTYYHFQMPKHYKCAICGKYRLKHCRPIRTQSLKEYVEKTIWVEFSSSNVTGWYCTCKIGARTVGCCPHVASVVWYLGYQKILRNEIHSVIQILVSCHRC